VDRLSGKVALVTGAARGIGAAIARLFLENGAKVAIADVLDEGAALSAELGQNAFFQRLDVSNEADWARALAAVEGRLGQVDVLVNNAAIVIPGVVVDLPTADFLQVLAVNLVGPFLGMKHVAPGMMARGAGSIINISSNQGLIASNGMAAYGSSKWGLRGLTKTAALELGLHGVRVNSVLPGPVNTPMGNPGDIPEAEMNRHETFMKQPIQRIARPSEIAQVCLFLASDDASYVTGAEIAADGGMTIGQYIDFLPGAPSRAGA
jgi:3alpha(or 20beta)-hydroxysteroid dehydrogenase